MTTEGKSAQMLAALKADIDKGLSYLTAGQVKDFDSACVAERGRKLSQTIAEVRTRFADVPPEELAALIHEAVAAARNGQTHDE